MPLEQTTCNVKYCKNQKTKILVAVKQTNKNNQEIEHREINKVKKQRCRAKLLTTYNVKKLYYTKPTK